MFKLKFLINLEEIEQKINMIIMIMVYRKIIKINICPKSEFYLGDHAYVFRFPLCYIHIF